MGGTDYKPGCFPPPSSLCQHVLVKHSLLPCECEPWQDMEHKNHKKLKELAPRPVQWYLCEHATDWAEKLRHSAMHGLLQVPHVINESLSGILLRYQCLPNAGIHMVTGTQAGLQLTLLEQTKRHGGRNPKSLQLARPKQSQCCVVSQLYGRGRPLGMSANFQSKCSHQGLPEATNNLTACEFSEHLAISFCKLVFL